MPWNPVYVLNCASWAAAITSCLTCVWTRLVEFECQLAWSLSIFSSGHIFGSSRRGRRALERQKDAFGEIVTLKEEKITQIVISFNRCSLKVNFSDFYINCGQRGGGLLAQKTFNFVCQQSCCVLFLRLCFCLLPHSKDMSLRWDGDFVCRCSHERVWLARPGCAPPPTGCELG